DFLALEDGRLAVVLGDVTGHGVDATADMAMAKFVFRSLAREHPEPSDFLASANDVICSEIGPGKFISMSYVVVDGGIEARRDGELYGDDRLDALLAERRELSARSLAAAVAEDAREFAGGDLS